MKKILIVIITVLCCTFLLCSCKNSENQDTPSNENGAGENTEQDPDSPDSKGDTTKPGDQIQAGGSPEPADASSEEQIAGDVYYTIVNQSDDSHIRVSFLNSLKNSVSILLEEYDCVKVTEAQFQNNIFSIVLVDADKENEDEPFCGAYCSSSDDDCYEKCPVDNYRVLDAFFDDEIDINQSRSLRQSCVPLFQFQ